MVNYIDKSFELSEKLLYALHKFLPVVVRIAKRDKCLGWRP